MATIYSILLFIDGIIYDLIDGVYDIFDFLARVNLFGEDAYNEIVGRIYIVLGVIMLFVLAYALLRAIINPDEFAKGETSFPNLAKNIVISLIIIVLLPTIFTLAFNVQNALLNTGTITKLILGDTNANYTEVYDDDEITMSPGRMIAVNTFGAFFYSNPEYCGGNGTRKEMEDCKDDIYADGIFVWRDRDTTLRQIDAEVRRGHSMTNYSKFSQAVVDDQIKYTVVVSTVCGIFLLYVLLNFVFDVAVRVVKLMFYQIIAPIPVICRVIPFGGIKDVFKNWLKQVTSTFFEVFVRIAIMNFGVLVIKITIQMFENGYDNGVLSLNHGDVGLSWLQYSLAKVLVMLGAIMFIRKAPELISKMFGIDTSGMKLGLRDRLRESGVYAAGAAVQGGLTTGVTNAVSSVKQTKKKFDTAKAAGDKSGMRKAVLGGALRFGSSTAAGFGSGFARSGYNARGAKNMAEARDAAKKGIAAASDAKTKRDNYRATHLIKNAKGEVMPIATAANVGWNRIKDRGEKIGEKIGINNLEALNKEKAVADEARGFYTEMAEYVKDNEMVANFTGLYEAEMQREITGKKFDEVGYNKAVAAEKELLKRDTRHGKLSGDQLEAAARSRVNRANFETDMTQQELADAIDERQANLKRLDSLKKLATIKAINDKLNDVGADGKIVDGRFQAVANKVKVFKEQHPDYEFVDQMSQIKGVTWQTNWEDTMLGKNATSTADYNAKVDALMSAMKKGTTGVNFFSDSERAKNQSGAVSAEIAKKIQEKKAKE